MAASSSRHTEILEATPEEDIEEYTSSENAYSYRSPQDIEEGNNRNPERMACQTYKMITQSQNIDKITVTLALELKSVGSVSCRGNSVIHLLASSGHSAPKPYFSLDLQYPAFFLLNNDGDLPLHLAASTGNLDMVKWLVKCMDADSPEVVRAYRGIRQSLPSGHFMEHRNNRGNTALHVALENNHQKVAEFLVDSYSDCSVILSPNNYKKTPLCMAAEAGNATLFEKMISRIPKRKTGDTSCGSCILPKKVCCSILRGAILGRHPDILNAILKIRDAGKDGEWMTPLTLAVYINNFEAVSCLLSASPDAAYQMDGNGFLPIHVASRKGYVRIVEKLLNLFPDSRELHDRKGQNILHVAAGQGREEMVKYITKKPELEVLFNERDTIGDTPLHVAVRNWHPRIVTIMTGCRKVNLHLLNNAGMTALDIAEDVSNVDKEALLIRRKLTYVALKLANAPRSEETLAAKAKPVIEDFYSNTRVKYDDLLLSRKNINTLLLVSTLVATITFAAGFTMPGGYNSSGNDEGMATLVTKWPFQVFVICNTMAMYSSITVAIALIWAQTGDHIIVYAAMRFVLPMLGMALIMMSTAFLAGVALVTSNLIWLWCINTIIGSSFLSVIVLLFAPLTVRLSSEKFITRGILRASFSLLLMVTRYDTDVDVGVDGGVDVGGGVGVGDGNVGIDADDDEDEDVSSGC